MMAPIMARTKIRSRKIVLEQVVSTNRRSTNHLKKVIQVRVEKLMGKQQRTTKDLMINSII
jgi:hypothetical protein